MQHTEWYRHLSDHIACMTDRWAAGDIIAPSSEAPHRMRGLWSLETTPCTITITLLLLLSLSQRILECGLLEHQYCNV